MYIITIIAPFHVFNNKLLKNINIECIDKNTTNIDDNTYKYYTYTTNDIESIQRIYDITKKKNNKMFFIDGIFMYEEDNEIKPCQTIYASEFALKTWISNIQIQEYKNKIKSYDGDFKEIYEIFMK